MQTFKRICIKDFSITDDTEKCLKLRRGQEYITSSEKDNEVTVFAQFWVKVPVDIFSGELEFTGI